MAYVLNGVSFCALSPQPPATTRQLGVSVDKLLEQLAVIDARMNELLAAESLTAEEQVEHDDLVGADGKTGKRAAVMTKIKRAQAQQERDDERAAVEQANAARAVANRRNERTIPDNRVTTPDVPTRNGGGGLIVPKTGIISIGRRYGNVRSFHGDRNGYSAEQRAWRFGMWALAIMGRQMYHRFGHIKLFQEADQWMRENIDGKQAAAVGSNDASGYQYLIPVEFSQDIIDLRETFGIARRLFKMEPMVSDTKRVPRRRGGLTAYWTTESAALTESNKTWDDVELVAKDLTALSRASAQVNADTVINWGDDLAREVAYAFAYAEDNAAFNGDGTSTYGRIVGVRTKLNLVDGTSQSAGLYLTSHASWTTLTIADFEGVIGLLPLFADNDRTCWLCHRAFYSTVMQSLMAAQGGVTMLETAMPPDGSAGGRARPMFLGYPVQFAQVMPSTTAVSTVPVCLGDFAAGAMFGDRQDPEIAFSEHATISGQNVFERNQIAIRGTERIDINVHDVGFVNAAVQAASPGPIVGLYVHS